MAGPLGFTMIELLVSVLVLGLLIAVAAISVRNVDSVNLRSAARYVSATVRSAHDRARASGRDHRLVFDLDAEGGTSLAYEASAKGRRLSPRTLDDAWDEQKKLAGGEEAKELARAKERTTIGGLNKELLPLVRSTGPQWKKVPLRTKHAAEQLARAGRFVKSIFVARLDEEVSQGKVALYVQGGGRVELAAIYLGDGQGKTYTLVTQPLTGRVIIHDERVTLTRRAVREDDLGKRLQER